MEEEGKIESTQLRHIQQESAQKEESVQKEDNAQPEE
jgi:hypothetical protein